MRRIRVIPVLLIKDGGLVKSVQFKNHKYVGDPINAVRIFNDKEVDEICILDISASAQNKKPNLQTIHELTGEAFMPLAYGGGITSMDEIQKILYTGAEKVVINKAASISSNLISMASKQFGAQSIVVSIDIKKNWLGKYKVFTINGTENTGYDPVEYAIRAEDAGAGELLVNDISLDGTYKGYNIEMITQIAKAVDIPIIACGGAGSIVDFASAVSAGASAVAAGSMFVFQRPHQAVLISYPNQKDLTQQLFSKI